MSNFSDVPYIDRDDHVLLSPRVVFFFNWIMLSGLCQGIAVFGTAANVANIVCFVKQGFKNPTELSLFALALSDVGLLITVIWSNICNTPAFYEADLPFDVIDMFYLTSAMPHLTCIRISAWVTALITVERCLCITFPLKVKRIITVQRMRGVLIGVFITCIVTGSPLYTVISLDMKFSPTKNKTLYGLVRTTSREAIEKTSYTINNTVIPFTAFVVTSVCTIILVIKLYHNRTWRAKSLTVLQASGMSRCNQKVAIMVLMVSVLFIACFIPMTCVFIAIWLTPDLTLDGKNVAVILLIGGMCTILQSVNSSMNIFIYYHMSSKFRVIFHELFCACKAKNFS